MCERHFPRAEMGAIAPSARSGRFDATIARRRKRRLCRNLTMLSARESATRCQNSLKSRRCGAALRRRWKARVSPKSEVHRGDLRWPLAKDFARRLEGKTVDRPRPAREISPRRPLVRRRAARCISACRAHSMSFRQAPAAARRPAATITSARTTPRTTTSVFHMSSARGRDLQRSAPLWLDEDRRARTSSMHEPLLRQLGPEPLGNAFDAAACWRALAKGRRRPLKAALSDQRVVAGLGNIYVCEALHRARLSPKRLAATIAHQIRRPERARRAPGRGYQGGAQRGDQGRRLLAARSPAHRRRARDVPASLSRLRPRGRASARRAAAAARSSASCRTGRSTFYCPVCQK